MTISHITHSSRLFSLQIVYHTADAESKPISFKEPEQNAVSIAIDGAVCIVLSQSVDGPNSIPIKRGELALLLCI